MDYSKIGWIRRRSLIVTPAVVSGSAETPGPWHEVGDVGEPAFQNSWDNFLPGILPPLSRSHPGKKPLPLFDAVVINTDGTVKSGGNPGGYSVPGWSLLSGIRYPIVPPEVAP